MDERIIRTGRETLKMAADNIALMEQTLGEAFRDAVYTLHETRGKIIACGIGKSGIIAKKMAATLSSTGTFCCFIHPSEAFHGDFGMIKPEDTILLFSHSGETKELVQFMHGVRNLHEGNQVIVITAGVDSTLAKASNTVIVTQVAKESHNQDFRHIPTTSTTVTLALGDAIALALQTCKGFKEADFFKYHPGGNIGKIAKESKVQGT